MICKDYLKLSEIASYSKLARASKAPPPPLRPLRNRIKRRTPTKPDAAIIRNRSTKTFKIFLYSEINYFVVQLLMMPLLSQ